MEPSIEYMNLLLVLELHTLDELEKLPASHNFFHMLPNHDDPT